jgi:hypothetical protein
VQKGLGQALRIPAALKAELSPNPVISRGSLAVELQGIPNG